MKPRTFIIAAALILPLLVLLIITTYGCSAKPHAIAFVEPTAALRLTLLVNDGDAIMSTVISEDDNCDAWRKREYASGQLNIKRLDIEKEAISFQQRYWRDKNEPQPTFNSSYKPLTNREERAIISYEDKF